MKKYIGIALAIVAALFVMAMVISGSDGQDDMQYVEANEEGTEKSSFISSNDEQIVNLIEQNPMRFELPCNTIEVAEQVVGRRGYTLSYNPTTLVANWVAYELTANETDGPWTRRGLRFMPDPNCMCRQADNDDYRNSGYSRGHLAPAGDMKWDSVAMLESFYFTNCIPQDEALNNGRWNQLEMKARTWAKKYGSVYVVCGPVFYNSDTLRIGHNHVAVPDACFKALLIPKDNDFTSIAFIMRNDDEDRSLKECGCTVDELEALLGLDLFCNLPDNVEESIESKITWGDWGLR